MNKRISDKNKITHDTPLEDINFEYMNQWSPNWLNDVSGSSPLSRDPTLRQKLKDANDAHRQEKQRLAGEATRARLAEEAAKRAESERRSAQEKAERIEAIRNQNRANMRRTAELEEARRQAQHQRTLNLIRGSSSSSSVASSSTSSSLGEINIPDEE